MHRIPLGSRTRVMGVLNCTPDSFSDPGRFLDPESARRRLHEMEEEGADWIDVGGESTRPGAELVDVEEEWRRISPVLLEAQRCGCPLPISVDTTKAEIARRAADLGIAIINDVSALRFEPGLAKTIVSHGLALVLMHMRGEPRTMQDDPTYDDVMAEIRTFLVDAMSRCLAAGVSREQLLVDPGIGFGKTAEHNLEILRRLPEFASLGAPLLVGASRKRFLGTILGLSAEERLEGSRAAHAAAALGGAHVIRAHDVRATVRMVRVIDAIRLAPDAGGDRIDAPAAE